MTLKRTTKLLREGLKMRRLHMTRNLGMSNKDQAADLKTDRKYLSHKWIRDREIASRHTRKAAVTAGQKKNIKAGKMP